MNIPEGWKLVPIEPTKEIIDAWENATWEPYPADTNDEAANWIVGSANYKAMISAAPTPPAQEVEPIYQVYLAFDKWRDVDQHIYDALTLPKRIVYTHPQSDEIRKAAERRLSAWEGEEGSLPWRLNRLSEEIDNLRAALEEYAPPTR